AGDPASTCGSLFVDGASTGITFESGAQCFDLEAGIYDLRWFYMTGIPKKELRVRYCFGDGAACTPTEPVSNRMLRPEFAGEPECEQGAPATELCPGTAGSDCTQGTCQPGLTCSLEAGARFGRAGGLTCWNPACDTHPTLLGCGYEGAACGRSEEHTSELQSRAKLVCRPLLET